MSDTPDLYTPTDEEVRERYIASEPGYMRDPLKPSDPDYEVTGQEYDRWTSARDARIRTESQAEQREADAAIAEHPAWHPLGRLNDVEHATVVRVAAAIRGGKS